MNFAERITADCRAIILRTLADAADYTANEATLDAALQQLGHHLSRDKLRTELAWLEEQSLVIAQQPAGVCVVTLSARGYDVARDTARVPGVARPRPE